MNYRIYLALAAIPSIAMLYWLPGPSPEPARVESNRQAQSAQESAESPQTDRRLQQLERRLHALQGELAAAQHAEEAPAPIAETPPATESAAVPPEHALDPDAEIAQRLDDLNNLLLTQRLDAAETAAMRSGLTDKLSKAGLNHVRLDSVDCYQTLCKLGIAFDQLQSRDADLGSALLQLDDGYFAHVATAEATVAEVYAARPGHALLPPDDRAL